MHSILKKCRFGFPLFSFIKGQFILNSFFFSKFISRTRKSFGYYPPEHWERKLELLAGLLNTESIDFDEALEFQNEIDNIYGETFKTREILKALAPRCDNIIVECHWAGQTLDCKEQFKLMAFLDGTCCVFNYQYER